MRFKNNGDYLHCSLRITRAATFARACVPMRQPPLARPPAPIAIPLFWSPVLLPPWLGGGRITRGKTMPRKKTHYNPLLQPRPAPSRSLSDFPLARSTREIRSGMPRTCTDRAARPGETPSVIVDNASDIGSDFIAREGGSGGN
jgi:hypothetical protein